jgi:hypothetical protein
MIKTFLNASFGGFLFLAASAAAGKDQNACDTISYVAPAQNQAGRSEWRCALHENGLKASLITIWKLKDDLPVEAASHAEVLVDGETQLVPIGKVFEAGNLKLGPRTQQVACNGYYDLLLPIEDTASRNPNFATWRFDVTRRRYLLHKPLTALRNPEPLAGCGCYQTYNHGGGANFSYELWCNRAGVLSKTREIVQRSSGPAKINDPRDYQDPLCHVRDTRFDANGKAKTRHSKRCTDIESIAISAKR